MNNFINQEDYNSAKIRLKAAKEKTILQIKAFKRKNQKRHRLLVERLQYIEYHIDKLKWIKYDL